MKYISFILTVAFLSITTPSNAQVLRKLGKKLEQKAEEMVDRSINNIENSQNQPPSTSQSAGNDVSRGGSSPFALIPEPDRDFERGTEQVFYDDFSNEVNGNMASKWTSNGTGKVEEVSGIEGKWLKLYDANTYKIKDLVRIPENFTIEFDLLTLSETKNEFAVDFGFDYQKGVGSHYYLADRNPINIEASYRFNWFEITSKEVDPSKKSEVRANMSSFVNDVMKVKIRVVGKNMQTYINGYKILDTEMVDPTTKKYFYLAVDNESPSSSVYFSNFRIDKLP